VPLRGDRAVTKVKSIFVHFVSFLIR
jgi:hypothetical protein